MGSIPEEQRLVEQIIVPAHLRGQKDISEILHLYNIPGLSVAVIKDGDIHWAQGYGVKNVTASNPESVTTETLFQAASISKPIAGLAALRLVDRGELDLDVDVNTYLKGWQLRTGPTSPQTWQPQITLRQLLTHTAGVSVSGFYGYRTSDSVPTIEQLLKGESPYNHGSPIYVETIPGLEFRYSGGGISVIQKILMDVTGKSFPQLMKDLIFDPLEMTHSIFAQPLSTEVDNPVAFNYAAGHYNASVVIPGSYHVYPELAAAGLWSTPTDLCKLAIAVQKCVDNELPDFLSAKITKEMLTPDKVAKNFGLGFRVDEKDAKYFSHTGHNDGYSCILQAGISQKIGWAVMINSNEVYAFKFGDVIPKVYGWPDYNQFWRRAMPSLENKKMPSAPKGVYGIWELEESDTKLTISEWDDNSTGALGMELTNLKGKIRLLPAVGFDESTNARYISVDLEVEVQFVKEDGKTNDAKEKEFDLGDIGGIGHVASVPFVKLILKQNEGSFNAKKSL